MITCDYCTLIYTINKMQLATATFSHCLAVKAAIKGVGDFWTVYSYKDINSWLVT